MIIVKKPKIRFKGFTETWEQRKLNDISEVRDGTHDSPKYQNTGHPFVTSKNIKDGFINYDDIQFISDEDFNEINKRSKVDVNDILMGMIGTIGNTALIRTEPDFAIKNVALIKDTKQINYLYLYHFLHSPFIGKQLSSGMDGGTQKFVSLGNVRNLDIVYPSEVEQIKLGEYFDHLDHLITLHQRQCENLKKLKKFMLQKLFPQNGESVPKIRFLGFTDTWEQRKLGEICSRVQGNDGRMELPTLTISAANGWMKQEDRFTGNIAGKEQKNYTLLHRGELSYNHGNSKLAKYGTVFSLQTYEEALVPRVYHSFKVEIGSADFIEYFFATKMPDRELRKLISSGARMDGLLNIGYDDFMGIKMMFPSVLEQDKIAEYFRAFDHLITLHQSKCDKLKEVKKYMLQNMFI